jgi:hypothetical protein
MKKILTFLLAATLSFACTLSTMSPPPTPTSEPAVSLPPTVTVTPPPTSDGNRPTLVYIHRYDGALYDQLAEQVRLAAAVGQEPIAYLTASWCPACTAVSDGLSGQHPAMMEAFSGIYLIGINVDEWDWNSLEIDFPALREGIPLFYRLDENGRPTDDWINGGAWEENTPENIARAMDPWLHR